MLQAPKLQLDTPKDDVIDVGFKPHICELNKQGEKLSPILEGV